jgi:hypothetical protein
MRKLYNVDLPGPIQFDNYTTRIIFARNKKYSIDTDSQSDIDLANVEYNTEHEDTENEINSRIRAGTTGLASSISESTCISSAEYDEDVFANNFMLDKQAGVSNAANYNWVSFYNMPKKSSLIQSLFSTQLNAININKDNRYNHVASDKEKRLNRSFFKPQTKHSHVIDYSQRERYFFFCNIGICRV